MTEATREYHRRYQRERRQLFIEQGRCLRCGWDSDTGKRYCSACGVIMNKNSADWRRRKTLLGLCSRCGKRPAREGFLTCETCSNERKNKLAEARMRKKGDD